MESSSGEEADRRDGASCDVELGSEDSVDEESYDSSEDMITDDETGEKMSDRQIRSRDKEAFELLHRMIYGGQRLSIEDINKVFSKAKKEKPAKSSKRRRSSEPDDDDDDSESPSGSSSSSDEEDKPAKKRPHRDEKEKPAAEKAKKKKDARPKKTKKEPPPRKETKEAREDDRRQS